MTKNFYELSWEEKRMIHNALVEWRSHLRQREYDMNNHPDKVKGCRSDEEFARVKYETRLDIERVEKFLRMVEDNNYCDKFEQILIKLSE